MSHRRATYVTLLTKLSYLPGALVLEHGLRKVGSKYPLLIMVTAELPGAAKELLQRRKIGLIEIESLLPKEGTASYSKEDIRFKDTWTKLRVFELAAYDRIVMLDSDMIVRRNMDELMDLELPSDWIAAGHACACNPRKLPHYPKDWIPENCAYTPMVHPDCLMHPTQIKADSPRPYGLLNSGLIVLNPSKGLMDSITNFLWTSPLVATYKFPDQDLLAEVFRGRWKSLPYCYNALWTLRVIHTAMWRDEEVRCIHYIFKEKPWMGSGTDEAVSNASFKKLRQWWWADWAELRSELKASETDGLELIKKHMVEA